MAWAMTARRRPVFGRGGKADEEGIGVLRGGPDGRLFRGSARGPRLHHRRRQYADRAGHGLSARDGAAGRSPGGYQGLPPGSVLVRCGVRHLSRLGLWRISCHGLWRTAGSGAGICPGAGRARHRLQFRPLLEPLLPGRALVGPIWAMAVLHAPATSRLGPAAARPGTAPAWLVEFRLSSSSSAARSGLGRSPAAAGRPRLGCSTRAASRLGRRPPSTASRLDWRPAARSPSWLE